MNVKYLNSAPTPLIIQIHMALRVSIPELNRETNSSFDLAAISRTVKGGINIIFTVEADYTITKDPGLLLITPNPRAGNGFPLGFILKNISAGLADELISLSSEHQSAREKRAKPLDTSNLAHTILTSVERYAREGGAENNFRQIDKDPVALPITKDSAVSMKVTLHSSFKEFTDGILHYEYKIGRTDNLLPNETIWMQVETQNEKTRITAYSRADKRILACEEKHIGRSHLDILHNICRTTGHVYAHKGYHAAVEYLKLERKHQINLFPAADPVPDFRKIRKKEESLVVSKLPKRNGWFTPYLSQIIPHSGDDKLLTIRESLSDTSTVLEIVPLSKIDTFLWARSFNKEKFHAEIKSILSSAQIAEYRVALSRLEENNFGVRVAEDCSTSPLFKELIKYTCEKFKDKINIFEASDSRRLGLPISKDLTEVLFIETLKGRHFVRFSVVNPEKAANNFYYNNLSIIYDNDGNGQFHLENANRILIAPINSSREDLAEYFKRKIRLFSESPYFLLDELLREQQRLPFYDRNMTLIDNYTSYTPVPLKASDYNQMAFNLSIQALHSLIDKNLKLEILSPIHVTGWNYVIKAINKNIFSMLEFIIADHGLTSAVLKRATSAGFFQGTTFETEKVFQFGKMGLITAHNFMRDVLTEFDRMGSLTEKHTSYDKLFSILRGKALEVF